MKDLIDVRVYKNFKENGDNEYTIKVFVKEEQNIGPMSIKEIERMLNYMPETMDDLRHLLFEYYESKIIEENNGIQS